MPNLFKVQLLESLRRRFGELHKLPDSKSLFKVGNDAARVYLRYSKVHPGNRTFFGLRISDLRRLEGHNAFVCFFFDNDRPPVFLPYAEFEEIFANHPPAGDDSHKVQLLLGPESTELYIPRLGRFNVDGYIGIEFLRDRLESSKLQQAFSLSHGQVQSMLAAIGYAKGYGVWLPKSDAGSLDRRIAPEVRLLTTAPNGYNGTTHILCEIDVIWVASGRDQIVGLFEVEHSTPIYSGLLRFNDMLLTDSRLTRFMIVSNDTRRSLFSRQVSRPTFTRSGLSELASFLDYANVMAWHSRLSGDNSNE